MYEGPPTRAEARLETTHPQVKIVEVDGKGPVAYFEAVWFGDRTRVVYVLPGKHVVQFKFTEGTSYAYSQRMWFIAEPGKTYRGLTETASRNFLVGTTSVRFWIHDSSGRPVGGIGKGPDVPEPVAAPIAPSAPAAPSSAPALAVAAPSSKPLADLVSATPGCKGKALSFSDGSRACMEQFEVFSAKIGVTSGISALERANTSRTFAFAVAANEQGCRAAQSWHWNGAGGGDEARAREICEASTKKGARNPDKCLCTAIVPVDGNVPMTQKEFVAALFGNYYRMLDGYRRSEAYQSRWAEIDGLKKNLLAQEQDHYQRLR